MNLSLLFMKEMTIFEINAKKTYGCLIQIVNSNHTFLYKKVKVYTYLHASIIIMDQTYHGPPLLPTIAYFSW